MYIDFKNQKKKMGIIYMTQKENVGVTIDVESLSIELTTIEDIIFNTKITSVLM